MIKSLDYSNHACRFNSWSVTLLDSLDTMWIMDLHDESNDAVRVVASQNFEDLMVPVRPLSSLKAY